MRIRSRPRPPAADDEREPVPADEAMAGIRRAEEAAAARLAAEEADQAAREDAQHRAAALLDVAGARAAELARQRRQEVRAESDAEAERERAAAAAAARRLRGVAQERHDLAVELAVAYVLTGEFRCSSR